MIEPSPLQVVGAVIVGPDGILVAQRGPSMKLSGLWEFPGGKIEAGEGPHAALEREIHEELGVHIQNGDHIATTNYRYEFADIELSTYYATILTGKPVATEHSDLRWCQVPDLASLEWAPADVPSVERIVAELRDSDR